MRLLILFICLIVAGCKADRNRITFVQPADRQNPYINQGVRTRLTKADAFKIAEHAAIKDGRVLARYNPPSVEYDKEDGTWFIFYKGKVLAPGNHFSVTIKDKDGEVALRPGA